MEQAELLSVIKDVRLFLPESFEWLVLGSGIVGDAEIASILEEPSEHIESHDYFSWERFFTALLVERTQGTYLQYRKAHLNEAYLGERETGAILDKVPSVLLGR